MYSVNIASLERRASQTRPIKRRGTALTLELPVDYYLPKKLIGPLIFLPFGFLPVYVQSSICPRDNVGSYPSSIILKPALMQQQIRVEIPIRYKSRDG